MTFVSFLFFTVFGVVLGWPLAKVLLHRIEKFFGSRRSTRCIVPYVATTARAAPDRPAKQA